MISITTNLPAESALEPLRSLVALDREFSGEVADARFTLRLRPSHRKSCPVTIAGRVTHEAGRTCVTVHASPSAAMIVFFFAWIAFGAFAVVGFGRRSTTRSEAVVFGLFVLAGVVVSALSFRSESRRAYEIIRRLYGAEPCAAPNGGPATQLGNSGVTEGPPSVS